MARKQQNDPLRYAANLTALAAAVYLGVTALLRLAVGQLLRLFNKSATLENPIAVPEWVLGVFNVLLPPPGWRQRSGCWPWECALRPCACGFRCRCLGTGGCGCSCRCF